MAATHRTPLSATVAIAGPEGAMSGELELPLQPAGVVLFAHGSGSSRMSPRNTMVATALREAGLGTLRVDLMAGGPAARGDDAFDIALMTRRLAQAVTWLTTDARTAGLPIGLFGASTGAAAALRLAAQAPEAIAVVVCRGGRPDLAGRPSLRAVRAPVLLIVGGNDDIVVALNREALVDLRGERRLAIVPRATHLFVEPGALAQVARLAGDWFGRHFEALARSQAP
jgi:putative phosphoribosyl transferase